MWISSLFFSFVGSSQWFWQFIHSSHTEFKIAATAVQSVSVKCGKIESSVCVCVWFVRLQRWQRRIKLTKNHIDDAHGIKPLQFRIATANIWHHLKNQLFSTSQAFRNWLCNDAWCIVYYIYLLKTEHWSLTFYLSITAYTYIGTRTSYTHIKIHHIHKREKDTVVESDAVLAMCMSA